MPIARTSAAHAALHAFAAWSVDGVGFWCRDMPPEQLGSPKMPATMRIQGVLYLEDTSANGGGIRIVPGFHHKFEEWVGSIPEDDRGKNFGEQPTLAHLEPQVRTSPVLSLFILKMIILARQARDKHRESTRKRDMCVFAGSGG
jgi:hypothetical protein